MQQGAPPARTTHTPDMQYAFELTEAGLPGSGAHGVVRAARHVTHGDLVAVKVMPASVLGAVAKELIAQAKMHHPNIVNFTARRSTSTSGASTCSWSSAVATALRSHRRAGQTR